MNEQPIFEIRYADGKVCKIYEDGDIEKFPNGAMIVNGFRARMDVHIGKILLSHRPNNSPISLDGGASQGEAL
jgi:hypothetical protein